MMKAAFIFLILIASGCVSEPPEDETEVLNVEPIIDYYSLGGYTEKTDEMFFVAKGDKAEVRGKLSGIVTGEASADVTFSKGDALNFVIFRGVFGTGGYGITIDMVERTGNGFTIHATFSDPGKGMMVTQAFTQPSAIIPVGSLPEGSYEAGLFVTTISKNENGDSDLEHARVSFVVL
jgi:hypothetical protein